MMHIVMICTCPKRQQMVQTPWEFVPRVRIDGLEQPQNDPCVHGQNMQILCYCSPNDWNSDRSSTKKHNLDW